ncbi:MAG: cation:proton antiporter [Candidatus Omnitrophica bacterium]|nr:cation:proton antiporter [Candidatus Omnitrophota bacterium]
MSVTTSITLSNLELTRFFFAITSLLISAHFFGYFFHKFKLPKVIGEIFGGFLLGPTVLGHFFPNIHIWLFNAFAEEGKLISIIYWFGLILLMFVSGFEIQKKFSREDKKIIWAVILGATVIPLFAGWIAPYVYDFSPYLGTENNMLALKIVVAVAVAVTSIPVISKIFIDLNVINSNFAKVLLAAATVQDIILWIALAIATGLVSATAMSFLGVMTAVLVTIAFFVLALTLMPKIIKLGNTFKYNLLIKSSVAGYVLFICFLFSALASILNVNIVFGAFLAGIVIGLMPNEKFEKEKSQIKEIGLAFFIPVYFAVVGLKIDLIRHFDLGFFLWFLLFSSAFEMSGTMMAAKIIKKDWLSSFNLGVAMNTRGGPGIVLATVVFDLGIINEKFFVTLVLAAIVTSLAAGYWFKYVLSRGWDLLKVTR